MKEESFNTLTELQGLFHTLKFVGAARPTIVEMDKMAKIYKEEYGQVVNKYCPACVIEMIRVLSNQYQIALDTRPQAKVKTKK